MESSVPPCGGDPRRVFWHVFGDWHVRASDADLAQLEASLVHLAIAQVSTLDPPGPVQQQALQRVLQQALLDGSALPGIPGSLQQCLKAAHWPPAAPGP
jgi:hypothetical protein